ncbi:MAG: bacteriocin [Planctomycetaceae bacterium]|nr:MAG: bacteriocin [Planctomycetaceae bacterium]
MTSILRRSLAPITEKAWAEVDDQATQILKTQLSARRFVDVDGPHGWGLAAVDTGRLQLTDPETTRDVPWGLRAVLPLLEVRLPFVVKQMELDAISRGCKDPDLESLQQAVRQASWFEESAVYYGLPDASIQGLLQVPEREKVSLPEDPLQYPRAVAQAMEILQSNALPGPYCAIFGRKPFFKLMQQPDCSDPPRRLIEEMTGASMRCSPALTDGVVVSAARGHFELTVGQDWSIGYASHDRDDVELYITESFTFRVLEPAAVVELGVDR